MTDPTTLPDVYSIGQRRRNALEAFPPAGGGGGYSEPPEGPVPIETGEDPQPEPGADPCAHPDTALPWNADAAGASAVQKFLEKAAEIGFADAPNGVPNLMQREFGSYLLRGPGLSVILGPVTAGLAETPNDLTIATTGVTSANYQGDVHSHPYGGTRPSQEDWNDFMVNNRIARENGRVGETFYLYVIAVDRNGGVPVIRVYEDGPRAANSPDPARPTEDGPEVNPDALPCP